MANPVDAKIAMYVDALCYDFPPFLRDTLGKLPDLERRTLALHRYLLKISKSSVAALRKQWAWSEQEFDDFKGSDEDKLLTKELASVRKAFNAANSGHKLRTGPKFRNLQQQIKNWNKNGSIGTNAKKYFPKVRKEIQRNGPDGSPLYPDLSATMGQASKIASMLPSAPLPAIALPFALMAPGIVQAMARQQPEWKAVSEFKKFLEQKSGYATKFMVATPGLSDHGQARAIDFRIVTDGGEQVVGAGNPSKWESSGWAAKLKSAIRSGSKHFDGPLSYEPWHYDFNP